MSCQVCEILLFGAFQIDSICFTIHHTRPGHSDKPFAAPKPYTRPLTGLRYPLKNSSDTLLCRQHETLTDTILQKWGRLLMVFGVCV